MTDEPGLVKELIRKSRAVRAILDRSDRLEDGHMATYEAAAALDEALIRQHG